jgi:HEAT repeat protein
MASKSADPATPQAVGKLPANVSKMAAQQVKTVLAMLQSPNRGYVDKALDILVTSKPIPEFKKDILDGLEPIVIGDNPFWRSKAMKAVISWGGDDAAPIMAKVLSGTNGGARREAMDMIRDVKLTKAAPAVAERLTVTSESHAAAETLKALGSAAEPEVIKHLTHGETQVRRNVCEVLQVIGTKESLPELQKALTEEPNASVKRAVQDAIAAIERRKT